MARSVGRVGVPTETAPLRAADATAVRPVVRVAGTPWDERAVEEPAEVTPAAALGEELHRHALVAAAPLATQPEEEVRVGR